MSMISWMMSWLKLPIDSTTREERRRPRVAVRGGLTNFIQPFTNYYRLFWRWRVIWRLVCYFYPLEQGIGSEGLLLWNHLRRLLLTRSKTKVLVERCVETPYYTSITTTEPRPHAATTVRIHWKTRLGSYARIYCLYNAVQ